MATNKNLKSHKPPARKKSSTPSSTSTRTKKAASKASKLTAKSKAAKKKAKDLEDHKKLMELTLKAFQMTYDDYQQGNFHRIF